MQDPVIIFGAGTTGKIVADIFNLNNVLIYGFLDDKVEIQKQEIGSITIVGATDDGGLLKIIGNKTEAFVAIKNKEDRKRIVDMLKERRKTVPVNAIHPFTNISEEAILGHGNLVGAGSTIGAFARISSHNLIYQGVCIEPEVKIADFCEVGSGSVLGSGVMVEEGVFIGPGCTIVSGIKIGKNARIGAGSVVIEDVKSGKTLFGNPAKPL